MPTELRTRQKELGAFYTPRAMADKLVEWSVRSPEDVVLDPSFGGLVFVASARDRLVALGARDPSSQVFGIDVDADAHAAASRAGLGIPPDTLLHQDFFAVCPGRDVPLAQAVVGNPPYVRYQDFKRSAAAAHRVAEKAGVRLTRLASSWALFVVHGVQFVAPGGRYAQVLPAELLHGQYARPVLAYIGDCFARVSVAVFQERVFPGALQEVVLLFAEGRGEGRCPRPRIAPHSTLEELDVANLGGASPPPLSSDQPPPHREKLLGQLLPAKTLALLDEVLYSAAAAPLSEVASVDIGCVTGDNNFFLLSREEAGSIDKSLLRPTVSKARHVPSARFRHEDLGALYSGPTKTLMFVAGPGSTESALATASRYLREGKERKVDERFKCRVRDPWWSVPVPRAGTSALFLTYCSSEHPRLDG